MRPVVNNQRRDETLFRRTAFRPRSVFARPLALALREPEEAAAASGESKAWQKSGQLCCETATSR